MTITRPGGGTITPRSVSATAYLFQDTTPTRDEANNPLAMQVISKQCFNDPGVGGAQNLTGVFRPIATSLACVDSQGAMWGPGDMYEDPNLGVKIDFGAISNYLASAPQNSPYTVELSKSTWDGPASNDPVTITFKQHIDATDALRTGTYSKTLTFTLSTTTP